MLSGCGEQFVTGNFSHQGRGHLNSRRAQDLRMRIQPKDSKRWPLGAVGAGVYLAISGSSLHAVVVAWLEKGESTRALDLGDVHCLMVGLLVSARELLNAVAGCLLTTPYPRRWGGWTGWIQPPDSATSVDHVLDLSAWRRASTAGGGSQLLPEYVVPNVDGPSFDLLVREWLLLLFASNGVLDHEEDIERLESPGWLK